MFNIWKTTYGDDITELYINNETRYPLDIYVSMNMEDMTEYGNGEISQREEKEPRWLNDGTRQELIISGRWRNYLRSLQFVAKETESLYNSLLNAFLLPHPYFSIYLLTIFQPPLTLWGRCSICSGLLVVSCAF